MSIGMKSISLITKGENTCEALTSQLYKLLGDKIDIKGYCLDYNLEKNIAGDLIIISSNPIFKDAKKYIDKSCPYIIAHRSINYHQIYKLLNIPSGTDVLFVNDLVSATLETIKALKVLGIDHINYFPYYPGIKDFPKLKLAVTPGEVDLVPDFVEDIIDIKTRNIDFVSIVEIFKALKFSEEKTRLLSARYIRDIIDQIKKTKAMADVNNHIKNQLQTIINTVHDGIVALDEKKTISVFNPIAEEIFCYPREGILEKNIEDRSIRKDIFSILGNKEEERERFVKINNKYVVINSSYIKKDNSKAGIVYTLKDVTEIRRLEEELRRKLISRDNCARYTFNDITGNSKAIKNTRNLARKISRSDSPILIYGESGTGKELFAHAIHNASKRHQYPFVAVNFAALPESLLESELFGYEEGAFTGAKKGGKPGLFEQAHGGTIFLDEIGDAPVSFQIRLLRVLQEKEVRRIGSSRIIPIDVRVISATNKDLKALIEKGEFRQDLYYRLNVLPVRIPALRHRKQDILSLAETFYKKCFNGRFTVKAADYFKPIREWLLAYNWPGNIRELQNVVEYLVNVCPDKPPEYKSLPEEMRDAIIINPYNKRNKEQALLVKEILQKIKRSNEMGEPIGRRSIAEDMGLSEWEIRKMINNMRQEGYLNARRGIKGLQLTDEGLNMIESL